MKYEGTGTNGAVAMGINKQATNMTIKFPIHLCGINTRQLELLLWRADPTAQHSQDFLIFFKLNHLYKLK